MIYFCPLDIYWYEKFKLQCAFSLVLIYPHGHDLFTPVFISFDSDRQDKISLGGCYRGNEH